MRSDFFPITFKLDTLVTLDFKENCRKNFPGYQRNVIIGLLMGKTIVA